MNTIDPDITVGTHLADEALSKAGEFALEVAAPAVAVAAKRFALGRVRTIVVVAVGLATVAVLVRRFRGSGESDEV